MSERSTPAGPADDTVEGVTELVAEALDLEADARRVFLDRACADNGPLRAEVESLLDAYAESTGAAASDDRASAAPDIPASKSAQVDPGGDPVRVGRYRVVSRLGAGGMGTVYLAEQDQPVKRRVAVKVISGLEDPRRRRRFAAECQALARLNHPNIASMHEVGETDDGLPYVVMEWIDGQRITEWCDMAEATIESRIRLFLGVCAAIKHAHAKGILHLDLKPSNVLVTRVTGGEEVVKVIDFGISRALDEPLLVGGQLTQEIVLGSLPYMSPEAMRPSARRDLDPRSDVYSLGLILYELLVGLLPYGTRGQTYWTLLDHLMNSEPLAPSKRLAEALASEDEGGDGDRAREIAALRRATPKRLLRRLSGDLDAILRKAVDPDPDGRYGSPAELAVDLRRHLRHRPVKARKPTPQYVAGRFVRRNAGALLTAGLLLVALATGLVARTIEARRANAEAERAKQALVESEQLSELMIDLFEGADPERAGGEAITVRDLLDRGADRMRDALAGQPLVRARFLQTIGAIYTKLGDLPAAVDLVTEGLQLRREGLPSGHPDIIESESMLGVAYRRLGRYSEAEPLLLGVLAARQSNPDTPPELLAVSHSNLGNVFWGQERYDQAEASHRKALAIRERIDAEASTAQTRANVAYSVNNLGVMLLSRRRFKEAKPFLERAVELFQAEQHPHLAAALNNLGLVERNLSSWANAEQRFRDASAIWDAAFGVDDARSLNARRNLVIEVRARRRYDEAMERAREATAIAERLDNLPLLLDVLSLQATTEYLAGRLDEAFATLTRSTALAAQRSETIDLRRVTHEGRLALVRAASGEADRGVATLRKLEAALVEAGFEPTRTGRLRISRFLGEALMYAGRFAQAGAVFLERADRTVKRYGADDPLVAFALRDRGRALAAQGRHAEALSTFERALTIFRDRFGDRHPEVGVTALALADSAREIGALTSAEQHFTMARSIFEAYFPSDDPDRRAAVRALTDRGS